MSAQEDLTTPNSDRLPPHSPHKNGKEVFAFTSEGFACINEIGDKLISLADKHHELLGFVVWEGWHVLEEGRGEPRIFVLGIIDHTRRGFFSPQVYELQNAYCDILYEAGAIPVVPYTKGESRRTMFHRLGEDSLREIMQTIKEAAELPSAKKSGEIKYPLLFERTPRADILYALSGPIFGKKLRLKKREICRQLLTIEGLGEIPVSEIMSICGRMYFKYNLAHFIRKPESTQDAENPVSH